MKKRYLYGIEMIECSCGVWRVNDTQIPCWNHEDRKQLMSEAFTQLNQSVRNLGYEILKAMRLIK